MIENTPHHGPMTPPPGVAVTLVPNLLRGAEDISEFLFGTRTLRRRVYHLAETSKLPVFRLGSLLCARRSVLMDWIAAQEKRGMWGSRPALGESAVPRRPVASQATIARMIKGARAAGLAVTRIEIDPFTGRITLFADNDNRHEPTVLEAWRATRGAR